MIILLIDERPEEVTDMERNVNAEVIGGAFRVRVKGSAGKTVNWKVRFTKVEV